jgi:hypothetical protein
VPIVIKKANAADLPRADPVLQDPGCDFEEVKPTREGFDGPRWEWIPKLHVCKTCGGHARDTSSQGTPATACELSKRGAGKVKDRRV